MSGYVGTNSALAQKMWRPGVTHEAERQAIGMGFVSPDDDSGVVLIEEPSKKRGDKVQINFSPTNDQDGFRDQDTVEGNEAEVDTVSDELLIDYLGFAWRTRGAMSQQRVDFDQKKQIYTKAGRLWARRYEECFFNQLCGYTPAMGAGQDDYRRTGNNAVTAPDDQHIYRPDGNTTDQALAAASTDRMSLDLLTEVYAQAISKSTMTWPIAPCPDGLYHVFLSVRQWQRLRAGTSPGEWGDIERAKIEGGKRYEATGFARSFLGIWNNMALHVSDYITNGVQSAAPETAVTGVDRAVFLGARGAHMAFGQGYADGDHLDWSEKVSDHRKWSILVDSIFGLKTTVFDDNGTDRWYGAIVIPTYEAAT